MRRMHAIKKCSAGSTRGNENRRTRPSFYPIATADPIYQERYKPNLKGGLPTVRVQDSKGVTLYEESKDLPLSGEGLYSAIAGAVNGTEE